MSSSLNPANTVDQLSANVASLTAAVVSSERRHQSMERMFRWGAVAFIGFVALVFYVGFNLMATAHAATGFSAGEQSVAESLAGIDTNLAKITQGMEMAAKQGEGMMEEFGPTLQNVAVLIGRFKEDSDWLRANSKDKHASIAAELQNVSDALKAVPVMAAEMQRMSANMQVMSYSVGSTMGRVGSIMPW